MMPATPNRRITITPWMQRAIAAWTLVVLIITIRLLTAHNIERHSVYPPYIVAARHWVAGEDVYGPTCLFYRYSPLFAAAFTSFTLLSDRAGNIVWRWMNFAAYFAVLGWWMRCVLRKPESEDQRGIFLLLLIPLSVGSMNNGQANVLMTVLMLGALLCAVWQRWTTSAVLLALAVHLKLYPLALALVMVVLWPRQLGWRFMAALAGSVALSFVLQSPQYVAAQYAGWYEHLIGDLRLEQAADVAYRDLRLLLNVLHLYPGHLAYFILQLAGAAAVAVACIRMKRLAMPPRRLAALVYALVACWILLLGPSSESSTYILLAPALAWLLVEAWTAARPAAERAVLSAACFLLLVTMIANWLPFVTKVHALGLHPLAVLLTLGCVVYESLASSLRRSEAAA